MYKPADVAPVTLGCGRPVAFNGIHELSPFLRTCLSQSESKTGICKITSSRFRNLWLFQHLKGSFRFISLYLKIERFRLLMFPVSALI